MDTSSSHLFDITPTQRVVWYGQLFHSKAPIYNTAYSFRFLGDIDPDVFERTHAKLIDATDSLRMLVELSDNKPKLKVLDHSPGELQRIDAKSLSEEEFKAKLVDATSQELDLRTCPWQSTLFERPNGKFVWHLLHHHMFTDGFGFQAIFQRAGAIYKQEIESPHTADTSQTPSFANWIREYAKRPSTKSSEANAKAAHSSLYSSTPPTGRPHGERRAIPISTDLNDAMTRLIEQTRFASFSRELSLNFTLLTSIFALLSRIERRSDLCIGISNHGRSSKLEKKIAGLLISIDPLSVTVDPTDSFADLYEKVRDAFFEKSGSTTMPNGDKRREQSFDVTFNFLVGEISKFGDIEVEADWIYPGCHESANRWRIHYIATDIDRPKLTCDFNDEAFSDRGKRIAMQNILDTIKAFADDPDQKVGSYSLAGEGDSMGSIALGPPSSVPDKINLWETFAAIASEREDILAIEDSESELTYSQLTTEIEKYAQYLSAHSVEPDSNVPIIGERNSRMVQAWLATMKIGAAFLPIDSRLPEERINTIVEDSEAAVSIKTHSPTPADSGLGPTTEKRGNTAYTIYTSGTTGVPNGVSVGHRSVINFLEDMESKAPLAQDSKCMWWTAVNFDLSIYEVFSAILYGRTLCIPPDKINVNPTKLFQWMSEIGINSAYLPPFMLDTLNTWLDSQVSFPLRRLLVGVEPIEEDLLISIAKKADGLKIINGYGPTETTVCATLYPIEPDSKPIGRTPIGKPLAGNRCYILDTGLNLMPKGTVGELYIAGVGLAHGYWRRPELNSQRYLKDIVFEKGTHNELMYKTGDLVRLSDSDQLEFIGRADTQIKLRGQRIEPAEIEQTMLKLENVKRAFATVSKVGDQDELVFFYTSDASIHEESLYNHAAQYLPFQLIPKRFYHFETFPTTTNGKLDLAELLKVKECRDSERSPIERERNLTKPNGPVEEHILSLWTETFNTNDISALDSFFQLGGTSIDAMESILQLCNDFEVDIPLHTIFSHPRIVDLAAVVEQKLLDEIEQLTEEETEEILKSNPLS